MLALLLVHVQYYIHKNVTGAGYGRTGTTSLTDALYTLGMPCYHMKTATSKDSETWADATDGKKVDWEKVSHFLKLLIL
jgi:hypothetical protein